MATEERCSGEDVTDEQVSRERWQGWALVVGELIVLAGLCLLLLFAGAPLPNTSGEPPAWRTGSGFAITAVGFAIAGVGIDRMARAGVYSARTRAALTSYTRQQRRDAVRQVRAGAPVPQGAMPVATAMAMARQSRATALSVGIALTGVGTTVRIAGPWWMTVMALSAITLVAVAIPLVNRDARLAQHWLDVGPQQVAH